MQADQMLPESRSVLWQAAVCMHVLEAQQQLLSHEVKQWSRGWTQLAEDVQKARMKTRGGHICKQQVDDGSCCERACTGSRVCTQEVLQFSCVLHPEFTMNSGSSTNSKHETMSASPPALSVRRHVGQLMMPRTINSTFILEDLRSSQRHSNLKYHSREDTHLIDGGELMTLLRTGPVTFLDLQIHT